MTITARSDKIAPVADDGDATAQQTSSAGDAEAERPGNRKAKKLLTKLSDVIKYSNCRLKQTERKADETEKKNKKVLDKAERI